MFDLPNEHCQVEAIADDWLVSECEIGTSRAKQRTFPLSLEQWLQCNNKSMDRLENMDKLYGWMQTSEQKILELHMAARTKTAKYTQKVNYMLSDLTGNTSIDAFLAHGREGSRHVSSGQSVG